LNTGTHEGVKFVFVAYIIEVCEVYIKRTAEESSHHIGRSTHHISWNPSNLKEDKQQYELMTVNFRTGKYWWWSLNKHSVYMEKCGSYTVMTVADHAKCLP